MEKTGLILFGAMSVLRASWMATILSTTLIWYWAARIEGALILVLNA